MTYAKSSVLAFSALLVAGAVACGSLGDVTSAGAKPTAAESPGPAEEKGGGSDTAAPNGAAAGFPAASGLVVVHAAKFPSFRLCFENMPNDLPQPDSKIMPDANVVGVEVGSVVRLRPTTTAPGKVYVLSEKVLRNHDGTGRPSTCGELTGSGLRALTVNTTYHEAGSITQPLGSGSVQLLAITGCAGDTLLQDAKVTNENCNAPPLKPWDLKKGNLEARTITLDPTPQRATNKTIPVQLLNVAPALQAKLGDAQLEVTFGALKDPGPLQQPVASMTDLLQTSGQVTLSVEQDDPAVFGTFGFRIAAREPGGSAKFSVDQSLVAVQDFSDPSVVPTSYYQAASNYVLLLLGDPTFADAGANDWRGVHLLALPVLEPEQVDGGTTGAADAGAQ